MTVLTSPKDKSKKEVPNLPTIEALKSTASTYIGGNPNRTVKNIYDFRGYPKRKDFLDGFPEPVDSQFVLPYKLCPVTLTKHKYYPEVKLGSFSGRSELWGYENNHENQTPLKDIMERVGVNTKPRYANEYTKSGETYKVFLYEQQNAEGKNDADQARNDSTL